MTGDLGQTGTSKADDYLFQSTTSQVEFVVIAEDMSQLNDFCVHLLDATKRKVSKLEHESQYVTGGKLVGFDGIEMELSDDDLRDGAVIELDTWRDTSDFLARANCLLLLSCFTEKSLVWLCRSLGTQTPKMRGGQSKVATCIEFLKSDCGLTFEEPRSSLEIREQCRKLRNFFAHGEWEETKKLIGQVSLAESFAAITSPISCVENAYQAKQNPLK